MKHPHSVDVLGLGRTVSPDHGLIIANTPAVVLARERQEVSLEEAVNMLTFVPASHWGLQGRGLIREGYLADINVFDAATVAPRMPVVKYDLPAGARRLVQKSDGIKATVVNGRVVLRDSEPTGALPGSLLRGPLAG